MSDVLEVKASNSLMPSIDYGIVVEDLKKKVAADLAITINGVEDKAGYKLADTRRKEWVKVRTSIDKRRKEMNAAAREHIKRVDGVAAELTEIAGQAEDHVTHLVNEIDAAIEKAERDKADAEYNAKNARLLAAGITLPRLLVDSLSEIEIDDKISEAEELARFRKAQAEREAAEKAERERLAAEEKERLRVEAERLAQERAEFARQQAEAKAEAERVAKIEADKLALERAELDRLRREHEESARLLREQQAAEQRKRDEEQARLDKIETERLAETEREKQAAGLAEQERIKVEGATTPAPVVREHDLKTWPEFFEPILRGDKRFEGRRDDRHFRVGDRLRLREWDNDRQDYTGRELTANVTYKLDGGQFGIDVGWCVLSIQLIEKECND